VSAVLLKRCLAQAGAAAVAGGHAELVGLNAIKVYSAQGLAHPYLKHLLAAVHVDVNNGAGADFS
jgi:hypothetical protein